MTLLIKLFNTVSNLIGFTTKEYDKELKPIYVRVKNDSRRNFR